MIVNELRESKPPLTDDRLGRLAQRIEDRHRQDRVRRHAVAVAADIAAVGYTQSEVAELLHITTRTLRVWRQNTARRFAPLIGRPATRSPRDLRNDVIHYLDALGPGIGLHPLRDAFPTLTRAELDDLLHRYRRVWRHRHRRPLHVLEWTTPGTVWAIDFAEAPAAIDGIFRYLLAVRDLASGQQLLWQPLRDATAGAAAEALASLLVLHGAPWVVKSDNGSAFGAPAVAMLLDNFGVLPLFSPPHTPSYNGSIEAGIGSLKQRTDAHAARLGHPGAWTCDDVVAAQLEANATARPRGPNGPTPDQAWTRRASLTAAQRVSFQQSVEDQRCTARRALNRQPDGPLSVMETRAVDRIAIRRALVEHDVLRFSRRSIAPPVPRRKAEAIS